MSLGHHHRLHHEHHQRDPESEVRIANLRSEQGIDISLRFTLGTTYREGALFTEKATMESVLIESESVSLAGKTITIILMNHYVSVNEEGQESHCVNNWTADLHPDEDYACFDKINASVFHVRGATQKEIYQCYPELAICLKGPSPDQEMWQVDPMNGTHNFRFSWDWKQAHSVRERVSDS